MAAPAGRGLAAARRPVVRRPGAVGARRPATAGGRWRTCGPTRARWSSTTTSSAARSTRPRASMLDRGGARARIVGKPEPGVREDMLGPRGCRAGRARDGRVIAVVTRHTNLTGARTPSRLELTYREPRRRADADGRGRRVPRRRRRRPGMRRGAPRVGDGVIRLDLDGVVPTPARTPCRPCTGWGTSATWSAGRSRRSSPTSLAQRRGPSTSGCALVVTGRAPWRSEVETPARR